MGIEKVGLNILRKIGVISGKGPSPANKPVSNPVKIKAQPTCDTFTASRPTFSELYNIVKLNNGRIRVVPKIRQVGGKILTPYEMPEYLYHITSEKNMEKIKSSGKLKVSTYEQLPGVYLFDRENFLARYQSVGDKKWNLCSGLLYQANKSSKKNLSNLVIIRIPTEGLLKKGRFRIRTQEDFFYYQDKVLELQRGLEEPISLRSLADDDKRLQFRKFVLANRLMTEPELDKFIEEMKQKIHIGYRPEQLAQLEKDKAVEYVFNRDICFSDIRGIQYKTFPMSQCIDKKTGKFNIENLRKILSWWI